MTVGLAANQANPEVTVNQMVDGFVSIDVAGSSDVNLTDFQATWAIIELTGAITADIDVTIPDVMNSIIVINNTTGSYSLTFKSLTGTGVVIQQSKANYLYCDGTDVNFVDVLPETISGKILKKNTHAASTPASSSGTLTLDLNNGNEFNVTLTENVTTLAFSNVPSGVSYVTLDLTQDGTGGRTFAWPASVKWPGGSAPTLTTTASANSVIQLRTKDGGTTWQGMLFGDDLQ